MQANADDHQLRENAPPPRRPNIVIPGETGSCGWVRVESKSALPNVESYASASEHLGGEPILRHQRKSSLPASFVNPPYGSQDTQDTADSNAAIHSLPLTIPRDRQTSLSAEFSLPPSGIHPFADNSVQPALNLVHNAAEGLGRATAPPPASSRSGNAYSPLHSRTIVGYADLIMRLFRKERKRFKLAASEDQGLRRKAESDLEISRKEVDILRGELESLRARMERLSSGLQWADSIEQTALGAESIATARSSESCGSPTLTHQRASRPQTGAISNIKTEASPIISPSLLPESDSVCPPPDGLTSVPSFALRTPLISTRPCGHSEQPTQAPPLEPSPGGKHVDETVRALSNRCAELERENVHLRAQRQADREKHASEIKILTDRIVLLEYATDLGSSDHANVAAGLPQTASAPNLVQKAHAGSELRHALSAVQNRIASGHLLSEAQSNVLFERYAMGAREADDSNDSPSSSSNLNVKKRRVSYE